MATLNESPRTPSPTQPGVARRFPWLALLWLLFISLSALTADYWPMPEPDAMDWTNMTAQPGSTGEVYLQNGPSSGRTVHYLYLLGTDPVGRDVLSRLVHGTRVSLAVGLLAPAMGLLAGGLLGLTAGFYRGRIGSILSAAMDTLLAFPGLVLLLAMTFYLGAGLGNLILALGTLTTPVFFRITRANTLRVVDREFVLAARMLGRGDLEVLLREILPNVALPVLAYSLLIIAYMIIAEGALSFLGLGVPAPTPSWGGMVSAGREVLRNAPHVSLVPAAAMFLTVLSFNLLGGVLRGRLERRESNL